MIGFLRGVLMEKTPDSVILDVAGVGYEIVVPVSSICALPPQGEPASLYIHTYVREDAIKLFGFASLFDRKVFEALISVSSVGPKLALALLGPLDGLDVCDVIVTAKIGMLTSIPGVGAKTAERLILELKDKLHKLQLRQKEFTAQPVRAQKALPVMDLFQEAIATKEEKKVAHRLEQRRVVDDLRSALVNLGYKDKQINDSLIGYESQWKNGEEIVLETALRDILKKLTGHVFSSGKDTAPKREKETRI